MRRQPGSIANSTALGQTALMGIEYARLGKPSHHRRKA